MKTIFEISMWLALTSQLFTVPIALRTYLHNRTATIGYFAIYIVVQAIRSIIGLVLASLAIHNLSFYNYSELFSTSILMLFTYSFPIEKSMKTFVLVLYSFYLIYFGFVLINPDKSELLYQLRMAMLFETVASAMILHSRLKNPNGLRFLQDPWSVIAFTMVSSISLSLLCLAASTVAGYNKITPNLITTLDIGNCVSVFLLYAILSHQLHKIRTTEIAV